ncbi:Cytochrome p450 [Thalictrum thalictroides]|uniref:Cytochrome p450 n=1 Tax=Thalictrum thalictroides TaxID=46969 RepID=A0A7J6V6F5_THATH|nr:Cytochrome p450 [Thalictrum thalictroides]
MPSPPGVPIIGNFLQLGKLPHQSLRDLSRKYGDLVLLHLGYIPTVIVSSAEMAREIKKTHDIIFAGRPFTAASRMLFYGGIDLAFSPYGEYWRQLRKICVLEILSLNRVQSFKGVREEEVALMMKNISRACSQGVAVNLSEMVVALSNNIVCRCALGKKMEGKDDDIKFGALSKEFMKLLGSFSFGDFFPGFGWMDAFTGLTRNMKRVSKELDAFLEQIIKEHRTKPKQDDADGRKDFVDILLRVQKDNTLDITITNNNIKAVILDMFLAGIDTTSTTIEWAIAELLKNPEEMKKAQEEVRRVVGMKSVVEEEDTQHMGYIKNVIKETLRLHPPAPLLINQSTATANVNGYDILPNTRVFINAWAIQRDPKSWDRPEEFIPERFNNNTIDYRGLDYEFLPFGSGRRGCPGLTFGIAVVEFVVANLIYSFNWELPGGANKVDLDMSEYFGITTSKRLPLNLIPVSPSL